MKHIISIVSLLIFFSSFTLTANAAASPTALRILHLNFNAEALNTYLKTERYARLKKYVREHDVDVVFVQESWSYKKYGDFSTKFAKDMNMDVANHFEDGVAGVFSTSIAIIAKKSLQMRERQYFKLPHSAPTLGDGHKWWIGFGGVNMLAGATITLPTGEVATVWTTHLSNTDSYQQDQAHAIVAHMQAAVRAHGQTWGADTTILTGDMNAGPTSATLGEFAAVGMTDLWQKEYPGDLGYTFSSDEKSVEYNPLTHGAGLFPEQYDYEQVERIDYVLAHTPRDVATSIGRVFTSPYEKVWMSDHFGLMAELEWQGDSAGAIPPQDSDFAHVPLTTLFEVNGKNVYTLPDTLDFTASSSRGFTLRNISSKVVEFEFAASNRHVYPSTNGSIKQNQIMSFAFFAPGVYPYTLTVHLYDGRGTVLITTGKVHVTN